LAVRVSVCCPTTVENGEEHLTRAGLPGRSGGKDVYLVIKSNFVRHPQVLEIRRLIKKSFFDKKDWLVR
jgi:hypothetical protein